MTWTDQLNGDAVAWLLEPETPAARPLALRPLRDAPPGAGAQLAARPHAPPPRGVPSRRA